MSGVPQGLAQDDLVLSASTLGAATSLADRIDAAAAAGFRGIGLRPTDRERALAGGATDHGLRELLRRRGVQVVELQALGNWALTGEAGAQSRIFEEALYALGGALGGRYLIAVGEIGDDLDLVSARFSSLCDRADAHGLAVALEFVPWTTIPDAATAWEIVRRADRANGGVLVDAWHHFRGAADEAALRAIPADRVAGVHLCDGGREVRGTLVNDARHHRLLPGHGCFDLDRFVRLLDGHGVRTPFAVEVLSDALHELPAADAAAAAGAAARAVLARARGAATS